MDDFNYGALFRYARKFADRCEATGRGTEFPTVRMAARRFRVKQHDVLNMMAEGDIHEIPDADYFELAVGVQISGVGDFVFDSEGDYQLEAYRKEPPHE